MHKHLARSRSLNGTPGHQKPGSANCASAIDHVKVGRVRVTKLAAVHCHSNRCCRPLSGDLKFPPSTRRPCICVAKFHSGLRNIEINFILVDSVSRVANVMRGIVPELNLPPNMTGTSRLIITNGTSLKDYLWYARIRTVCPVLKCAIGGRPTRVLN